jgi:hypothetical protein
MGLSGHDWSQEVCASALGSVYFIDVDIIDGGAGDGHIKAHEQISEGFVFAPAKHGQGLPAFRRNSHRSDRLHIADHDLTMFGELVDVGVAGDEEG